MIFSRAALAGSSRAYFRKAFNLTKAHSKGVTAVCLTHRRASSKFILLHYLNGRIEKVTGWTI
jgi:hypothetical protein